MRVGPADETETSADAFGYPAFFQKDSLLGAELVAAHTVDAVGIIEGGSFFARADGLGGTVLHTDVAVDAVTVQDIRSHPDEGSN